MEATAAPTFVVVGYGANGPTKTHAPHPHQPARTIGDHTSTRHSSKYINIISLDVTRQYYTTKPLCCNNHKEISAGGLRSFYQVKASLNHVGGSFNF